MPGVDAMAVLDKPSCCFGGLNSALWGRRTMTSRDCERMLKRLEDEKREAINRAIAAEKCTDQLSKSVELKNQAAEAELQAREEALRRVAQVEKALEEKIDELRRAEEDLDEERRERRRVEEEREGAKKELQEHLLQSAEQAAALKRSPWSRLRRWCGCCCCYEASAGQRQRRSHYSWSPMHPRLHSCSSSGSGADEPNSYTSSGSATVYPDGNPSRVPQHSVELINALIATEWKFISQWFAQQMKETVEPSLQALIASYGLGWGLSIRDTCSLGTTPVAIDEVTTETYKEVLRDTGETIENMQITGKIDYHGDAQVDVDITDLASVTVTGIKVSGEVVIELVKLTHVPPWSSAVRIFFPNVPDVDLTVKASILGIENNVGFLKKLIIEALKRDVIAKTAVLPNRLSIPFGGGDSFALKHPLPRGVLRLAVQRAQGLTAPHVPLSSWAWSRKRASEGPNPYAEISLGDQVRVTQQRERTLHPNWDNSEIHDLVVTDFDKQKVRIVVRDGDYGHKSRKSTDFMGRAEVTVADLVAGQRHDRSVAPQWFALGPEAGERTVLSLGWIQIVAQWRPCAQVTEITQAMTAPDSSWSLGSSTSARCLLVADLFYASGLPVSVTGIPHWAQIKVSCAASETSRTLESHEAPAQTSVDHGMDVLQPKLEDLGLGDVAIMKGEKETLARELWRKRVKLGAAAAEQESNGRGFCDVVWDTANRFILDQHRDAQVQVVVWRPLKGRSRSTTSNSKTACEVGRMECSLIDNLDHQRTKVLHCPLAPPGSSGASSTYGAATLSSTPASLRVGEEPAVHLKLRLRVCPLLPPPAINLSRRGWMWQRWGPTWGQAAAGLCAVRGAGADAPISFAQAPTNVEEPEREPGDEAESVLGADEDAQPHERAQRPSWRWWPWASRAQQAAAADPAGSSVAVATASELPTATASMDIFASASPSTAVAVMAAEGADTAATATPPNWRSWAYSWWAGRPPKPTVGSDDEKPAREKRLSLSLPTVVDEVVQESQGSPTATQGDSSGKELRESSQAGKASQTSSSSLTSTRFGWLSAWARRSPAPTPEAGATPTAAQDGGGPPQLDTRSPLCQQCRPDEETSHTSASDPNLLELECRSDQGPGHSTQPAYLKIRSNSFPDLRKLHSEHLPRLLPLEDPESFGSIVVTNECDAPTSHWSGQWQSIGAPLEADALEAATQRSSSFHELCVGAAPEGEVPVFDGLFGLEDSQPRSSAWNMQAQRASAPELHSPGSRGVDALGPTTSSPVATGGGISTEAPGSASSTPTKPLRGLWSRVF